MISIFLHKKASMSLSALAACLLFFGCVSQYEEAKENEVASLPGAKSMAPGENLVKIDSDRPFINYGVPGFLAVANADLEKKKRYIADAKKTLVGFRMVAEDARRLQMKIDNELVRESDRYVRRYVIPLLNDTEAATNRETAFDIAKLHLLSALLYCDVGSYSEAERFDTKFTERYGEDSVFKSRPISEPDIGFSTIRDGFDHIRVKLRRLS